MNNNNKNITLNQSRRNFLETVALASVASFLPFSSSSCDSADEFKGSGKVPFKVWEEMLQAIMTSSDYLPGKMEELIASKDAEAMFNFVKNDIQLIPTESHRLTRMGTKTKWGVSGVLRCGMANPREKVELLHFMYQKAGIDSKVVFERTDIKPEEVPTFFYRPVTRLFDPKISKKMFRSWENDMGIIKDSGNSKDLVKDDASQAKTLGEQVLSNISSFDKNKNSFDFRWDNYRTPTLEFTQDESIKYAHLFDPEIEFGALRNDGAISLADPVEENQDELSIKISYRDNIEPLIEKNLVSGKWNANEIIGKQVILNFLHGLSLEEQVITRIGNVRTFTPSLSFQAIDEDIDYMSQRSFLGDPITIDGKVIKINEQEKTSIDGATLIDKPNPDLQKLVTDISVKASVGGYPIVKLNVYAKDTKGKLIEGLTPKDFVISEDGIPVRALMENNQRTPKILILSDASFSMPKEYYKQAMTEFNTRIKNGILQDYPAATVDFWKTPSSLFTWLLKASQTNYDMILYATDGDNDDSFNEKNDSIYRAGPPALILNVRNSTSRRHKETFAKMAEITNGDVLDAKNQENVLLEIAKRIDELEIPPYVFSYASSDKHKTHTVEVSIDENRLKSKDSYKFLDSAIRGENGIIGIYLELKIGKNKPIKRVLAGWDNKNEVYDSEGSYAKSVEGILLGNVMIACEGEGPTLSMALGDLLKSKLSNRAWGEAYLNNDIKKAKEELAKGVIHIPAILVSMMAPLQDQITDESITFPSGYRMCLLKTNVGVEQNTISSFDYLPTSKYTTMSNEAHKSFATTVIKTGQLAVRESTLFEISTKSLLENKKWINTEVARQENWLRGNFETRNKDYKYWNEAVFRGNESFKIFDTSAGSKAFWRIDKKTGEMYGIMPDGSGGGFNRFEEQLEELDHIIDMYSKIFDVMGVGSTPIGIVMIYGKTLVKLYAIVSEVIIVMDASGMDEAIIEAMQAMACEIAKDMVKALTGGVGEVMGGLDEMISLMAGDENNPFSCS